MLTLKVKSKYTYFLIMILFLIILTLKMLSPVFTFTNYFNWIFFIIKAVTFYRFFLYLSFFTIVWWYVTGIIIQYSFSVSNIQWNKCSVAVTSTLSISISIYFCKLTSLLCTQVRKMCVCSLHQAGSSCDALKCRNSMIPRDWIDMRWRSCIKGMKAILSLGQKTGLGH